MPLLGLWLEVKAVSVKSLDVLLIQWRWMFGESFLTNQEGNRNEGTPGTLHLGSKCSILLQMHNLSIILYATLGSCVLLGCFVFWVFFPCFFLLWPDNEVWSYVEHNEVCSRSNFPVGLRSSCQNCCTRHSAAESTIWKGKSTGGFMQSLFPSGKDRSLSWSRLWHAVWISSYRLCHLSSTCAFSFWGWCFVKSRKGEGIWCSRTPNSNMSDCMQLNLSENHY